MSAATTIIRNAGEGELRRFFGGGLLTMKLTTDETAGSLMLFEDELAEGKMTPLHIHAHEDELLFVLEGEILVHIAEEDHAVGRHGLAFAPRGVPHAFLVTSPTARVLTLQTPGTAEAFYRGASEPAKRATIPWAPSTSHGYTRSRRARVAWTSSDHPRLPHRSLRPTAEASRIQSVGSA